MDADEGQSENQQPSHQPKTRFPPNYAEDEIEKYFREIATLLRRKSREASFGEITTFITNLILVLLGVIATSIYGCQLSTMNGQLEAARDTFTQTGQVFKIDERAWIELETIKPQLLAPADRTFPASFTCDLYPKNVGKTVARDIVVKAQDFGAAEDFGSNAEELRNTQDKMLLNEFKEMGTGKPVVVPANPVPRTLAPNSVSPVPFRMTCEAPQVFASGHEFNHWLVGRIDYCDQFQIQHWLKFCFYVVNARGEIWACKEGNDEDRNSEEPTPQTTCKARN
jgi:hypothetical protein